MSNKIKITKFDHGDGRGTPPTLEHAVLRAMRDLNVPGLDIADAAEMVLMHIEERLTQDLTVLAMRKDLSRDRVIELHARLFPKD